MTHYVCVEFRTYENGAPFRGDSEADRPRAFYGPFKDVEDATDWIEYDYPEDEDVWDIYPFEPDDPAALEPVNHPNSIYGDIPDEDIRDGIDDVPPKLT